MCKKIICNHLCSIQRIKLIQYHEDATRSKHSNVFSEELCPVGYTNFMEDKGTYYWLEFPVLKRHIQRISVLKGTSIAHILDPCVGLSLCLWHSEEPPTFGPQIRSHHMRFWEVLGYLDGCSATSRSYSTFPLPSQFLPRYSRKSLWRSSNFLGLLIDPTNRYHRTPAMSRIATRTQDSTKIQVG